MSEPESLSQNTNHLVKTDYEILGEFEQTIPNYIDEIKQKKQADHDIPQELSFYLNSSDSLVTLRGLDQTGMKIMTVSGSGEFAHVSIDNGATEICSFDISPVAAFNAELRHVALSNLTMHEYMQLFGTWTKKNDDNLYLLYDEDIYKKVSHLLSKEARLFFNLLFNEPTLLTFKGNTWGGFARLRYNKATRLNRYIGEIITTEEEYVQLQNKAKKVKFTQVICDATDMDQLINEVNPDQIYQSNVGYSLEHIIKIAHTNLKNGVDAVICTVSSNEGYFNRIPDGSGDFKNFYYNWKKIEIGDEINYELRNLDNSLTDVKIRVIGMDRNADYGLTLMVLS